MPLVSVHDIRRGVREAKKINGSLKVEFEGLRLLLERTKGVKGGCVVVLFMQNRAHKENLHFIYVIKHVFLGERKMSYYLYI